METMTSVGVDVQSELKGMVGELIYEIEYQI